MNTNPTTPIPQEPQTFSTQGSPESSPNNSESPQSQTHQDPTRETETSTPADESTESAPRMTDAPTPGPVKETEIQTEASIEPAPATQASAGIPEEPSSGQTTTESQPSPESEASATPSESVEETAEKPSEEPGKAPAPKSDKRKLSDEEAQPVWDFLKEAMEQSTLLSMHCVRTISGGAIVEFKGMEGFIPRSQFSMEGRVEISEIEQFIGQELPVIVIELSDFQKRKFIASRKRAQKLERFRQIRKGDVLEGTVTSITGYGAFVDLGGVDGLVHISRLSKVRVSSPSDVVKVNEKVTVRVVDVNEKNERISLSMKEFTESPWTNVGERYRVGDTIKRKVKSITDYGVYLQLEPGVTGMIHISDLSWTRRLNHPTEIIRIGESVTVKITDVRPEEKRISLSLKEMQSNPWPRLANIYPVNTETTGKIKRLMEAGAIVALDFDVDCFVPRGRFGGRRKGKTTTGLSVGEEVRVKVIEIDPDKQSLICSLFREERSESAEGRDIDKMSAQHTASGSSAFTFGELSGLASLFPQTEAPTLPTEGEQAPATETPVTAEAATQESQTEHVAGDTITHETAEPSTPEPPITEAAEPKVEEIPVAEAAEPAGEETPVAEAAEPAGEETQAAEAVVEAASAELVEQKKEETPAAGPAEAVAADPPVTEATHLEVPDVVQPEQEAAGAEEAPPSEVASVDEVRAEMTETPSQESDETEGETKAADGDSEAEKAAE